MKEERQAVELAVTELYRSAGLKPPRPLWVVSPPAGIEALDRWRCSRRRLRGAVAVALTAIALACLAPLWLPALALLALAIWRSGPLAAKLRQWRRKLDDFSPDRHPVIVKLVFPVWAGEIAGPFFAPAVLLVHRSVEVSVFLAVALGLFSAVLFVCLGSMLVAAIASRLLWLFLRFLDALARAWERVLGYRRLIELPFATAARGELAELGSERRRMNFEDAVRLERAISGRWFSGGVIALPPLGLTHLSPPPAGDRVSQAPESGAPIQLGWFYRGICVLCEPPAEVLLDEQGRLHAENGPAVSYGDGWVIHCLRGFVVRPYEATSPSLDDVIEAANGEVRDVLLERLGWPQFLSEAEAFVEQQDDYGRLWSLPRVFPRSGLSGVDLNFKVVEVVNSTPDPDGSFRHHFLHVPLAIRTARKAVAWTFAVKKNEYEPVRQT